jgi:fructoselysine-6-P-deglycase FrlB-like protein
LSSTDAEIVSQPGCWRKAAGLATAQGLPARGERVAVIGCGTSWFMAQAYAALRERAGHGETDAFAASEAPLGRGYDRVLAISRSGTTSEVLQALRSVRGPACVITAVPGSPATELATPVVLDFADEESIVQTRSATSALVLLRASLGEYIEPLVRACATALAEPLPAAVVDAEQHTFLGAGWAYGIAQEAALKLREAAGAWTEAYPALEYRHGPIAVARPGRVVWVFGEPPHGLVEDALATGVRVLCDHLDPLVDLVRAQRLAVAVAKARSLDPDRPRNLTRSVILPS